MAVVKRKEAKPRDILGLLRARRERPRNRTAECSQQFPPSDGDCHTPLPCEVRKGTIPRHERAVFRSRRQNAGVASPLSCCICR
jgi:hypothetical protein